MLDVFEICGTHIPLDCIKNYRVIQREYIYRPAYREKSNSIMKFLSNNKYEFVQMIPYAAVIDENEYKIAIRNTNINSIVQNETPKSPAEVVADVCLTPVNFVKDVTNNVVTSVFNTLSFGAFKRNKYFCLNLAGRAFETYLEEIPILVTRNDGYTIDVDKDNKIFDQIGEPVKPSIQNVTALLIEGSQKYLFFGNGIQIKDANTAYAMLKKTLENPLRKPNA